MIILKLTSARGKFLPSKKIFLFSILAFFNRITTMSRHFFIKYYLQKSARNSFQQQLLLDWFAPNKSLCAQKLRFSPSSTLTITGGPDVINAN
jgi:hypothetical protein